eukprot:m.280309 g.280309  ORF g.280309 m.280309 type:complete len:639 (-) comp54918_c0_seq4:142-2058(-)
MARINEPSMPSKECAFRQQWQPWDPHGVCEFDVGALARGWRRLQLDALVSSTRPHSPPQQSPPQHRSLPQHSSPQSSLPKQSPAQTSSTRQHQHMPAGHYLDFGTSMSITVSLTKRLHETKHRDSIIKPLKFFNRMVFIHRGRHFTPFIKQLEYLIMSINASVLAFPRLTDEELRAALSSFELTSAQQMDPTLDFVTGFYFSDRKGSVVVLEVVAGRQASSRLTAEVIFPCLQANPDCTLLMNTSVLFEERAYASLGPRLYPLCLSHSLQLIVGDTRLYMRDQQASICVRALSQLRALQATDSFSDLSEAPLFPQASDLHLLDLHFGSRQPAIFDESISLTSIPPSPVRDLAIHKCISQRKTLATSRSFGKSSTTATFSRFASDDHVRGESAYRPTDIPDGVFDDELCAPLSPSSSASKYQHLPSTKQQNLSPTLNPTSAQAPSEARRSDELLSEHVFPRFPSTDHVRANKAAVARKSEENSKRHPPQPSVSSAAEEPVFIYASQMRNTAEATRKVLQRQLNGQPASPGMSKIYSYAPDFQSLSIPLEDAQSAEIRKQEIAAKARRTSSGFQVTRVASSGTPNISQLPKVDLPPGPLFDAELRNPYRWDSRARDFDLTSRPHTRTRRRSTAHQPSALT